MSTSRRHAQAKSKELKKKQKLAQHEGNGGKLHNKTAHGKQTKTASECRPSSAVVRQVAPTGAFIWKGVSLFGVVR